MIKTTLMIPVYNEIKFIEKTLQKKVNLLWIMILHFLE